MALGKGGNFGRLVVISALGKTADKAGAVEIAGIFPGLGKNECMQRCGRPDEDP
jgi:hypothetical protein